MQIDHNQVLTDRGRKVSRSQNRPRSNYDIHKKYHWLKVILSSWQLCLVGSGIAQTNSWKVLTALPLVCSWLLVFLMLKGEMFSRHLSIGRFHGHFKSIKILQFHSWCYTTWQGDCWSSHVLLSKNPSHRLCTTGRLLHRKDSVFHWQRTWINYTNYKLNPYAKSFYCRLGAKIKFFVWDFTIKSITKTAIAAFTKSKRGSNISQNFRWIFWVSNMNTALGVADFSCWFYFWRQDSSPPEVLLLV